MYVGPHLDLFPSIPGLPRFVGYDARRHFSKDVRSVINLVGTAKLRTCQNSIIINAKHDTISHLFNQLVFEARP